MWTLNKMVQRNLFTKQVATDVETDMVSVEGAVNWGLRLTYTHYYI